MAWIDTDDVDDLIGEDVRLAVAPVSAVFDSHERGARARVQAALLAAGYETGPTISDLDDDTQALLKELVLGQWVLRAYHGRKGFAIPPSIVDTFHMLRDIRSGDTPVPGLTPTTIGGVGGFEGSATTGATGRPQMFSREALKKF